MSLKEYSVQDLKQYDLYYIRKHTAFFANEPALTASIGNNKMKFQLQLAASRSNTATEFTQEPVNVNASLVFMF